MLATALFYLPKDGSFVYDFYRGMTAVKQESLYFELLKKQLWALTKIVHILTDALAGLQKEPDLFGSHNDLAQSRQNLNSIILDARAGMLVIRGFLADVGHDDYSGSPNSPTL